MSLSVSLKDRFKNCFRLNRGGDVIIATEDRAQRRTSFDELKTASRYAQIELKSAVDSVSSLRNVVSTTNGTVSVSSDGEYNLQTTANANAVAQLQSGERGRYIPGYEAEVGIGIRIPAQSFTGTSKIENGDQASAKQVLVGGRQFSIYGRPNDKYRVTGERRTDISLVDSAWRPVISFRRKTNIGNNQSVKIGSVEMAPDTVIYFSFVLNGTLTGASFGNLIDFAPAETVVEGDISATAITGGVFLGGVHISTGSKSGAEIATVLQDLDFDFVGSLPLTLVARSVSGAASINAVTLNVKEQW